MRLPRRREPAAEPNENMRGIRCGRAGCAISLPKSRLAGLERYSPANETCYAYSIQRHLGLKCGKGRLECTKSKRNPAFVSTGSGSMNRGDVRVRADV